MMQQSPQLAADIARAVEIDRRRNLERSSLVKQLKFAGNKAGCRSLLNQWLRPLKQDGLATPARLTPTGESY